MSKQRELLEQSRLRQLFVYLPDTGELLWKSRPLGDFIGSAQQRWWNKKYAGRRAGGRAPRSSVTWVKVDGIKQSVKNVIFVLMTGKLPEGQARPRNGDMDDFRWENIRQDVCGHGIQNANFYRVLAVHGVTVEKVGTVSTREQATRLAANAWKYWPHLDSVSIQQELPCATR